MASSINVTGQVFKEELPDDQKQNDNLSFSFSRRRGRGGYIHRRGRGSYRRGVFNHRMTQSKEKDFPQLISHYSVRSDAPITSKDLDQPPVQEDVDMSEAHTPDTSTQQTQFEHHRPYNRFGRPFTRGRGRVQMYTPRIEHINPFLPAGFQRPQPPKQLQNIVSKDLPTEAFIPKQRFPSVPRHLYQTYYFEGEKLDFAAYLHYNPSNFKEPLMHDKYCRTCTPLFCFANIIAPLEQSLYCKSMLFIGDINRRVPAEKLTILKSIDDFNNGVHKFSERRFGYIPLKKYLNESEEKSEPMESAAPNKVTEEKKQDENTMKQATDETVTSEQTSTEKDEQKEHEEVSIPLVDRAEVYLSASSCTLAFGVKAEMMLAAYWRFKDHPVYGHFVRCIVTYAVEQYNNHNGNEVAKGFRYMFELSIAFNFFVRIFDELVTNIPSRSVFARPIRYNYFQEFGTFQTYYKSTPEESIYYLQLLPRNNTNITYNENTIFYIPFHSSVIEDSTSCAIDAVNAALNMPTVEDFLTALTRMNAYMSKYQIHEKGKTPEQPAYTVFNSIDEARTEVVERVSFPETVTMDVKFCLKCQTSPGQYEAVILSKDAPTETKAELQSGQFDDPIEEVNAPAIEEAVPKTDSEVEEELHEQLQFGRV